MDIEKFEYERHAGMVSKWLKNHSFPLPPKEMLPNVGFVVDQVACGFLYSTNSSLGWVEWVFGNPNVPSDHRKKALDLVFELLEKTAKELGITVLFSASKIPAYAEVLKRNGYRDTDSQIIHYIKLIE